MLYKQNIKLKDVIEEVFREFSVYNIFTNISLIIFLSIFTYLLTLVSFHLFTLFYFWTINHLIYKIHNLFFCCILLSIWYYKIPFIYLQVRINISLSSAATIKLVSFIFVCSTLWWCLFCSWPHLSWRDRQG